MIEIDGGQGEGGGQIVRTAIGLSSALNRDVKIFNIRKGRKKPGLRPQHLAGIKLAAEICDAHTVGLKVGSTEVEFRPKSNLGGAFKSDIGTAGSISLVLQTCLIPAALSKAGYDFEIRGGTDVPWSPPIDFLRLVLVPLLSKFGFDLEIEVEQRGYYPEGGGKVMVKTTRASRLRGIDLTDRGGLQSIDGMISCRNLPEHVGERVASAAINGLYDFSSPRLSKDLGKGPSTGVSIVLAAKYENTILGGSCLGEKGLPAEKVGETAAVNLQEELRSNATLDEHASDQLIPFLFLAEGSSSFRTQQLSLHAKTNISIAKQFVDRKIELIEDKGETIVKIS